MIIWKIEKISAILSDSEIAARQAEGPVVARVVWCVSDEDGESRASVTGQQDFIYDPAVDFTPYDQLTESQVLGWLHEAMGDQKQAFETMATQQLEQKKSPLITLPLPWAVAAPPISGNENDTISP